MNTNNLPTRQQELMAWLQEVFANQEFKLESLLGDASFRCYHRISFVQPNDKQKYGFIIMDAPPEKESIKEFVAVAELLTEVVNVPNIIAKEMDKGFLVLQDFGTVEFAHLLQGATQEQINDYYQWAIKALIDLQQIDIDYARKTANLPDYDKDKLLSEMNLFCEWFLPYIKVDFDKNAQELWQKFTNKLIDNIITQPKVVVHRDYHCRNLMQDQANVDDLGMIDFQDAVIGAYTYDLVSLLRDAYVTWDERQIEQWLADYLHHQTNPTLQPKSKQQFQQEFNIMGVQRHLKILGIFVRLSERDGKKRYLADIPKVMNDLHIELQWLVQYADDDIQQITSQFLNWLNKVVMLNYKMCFKK